MKTLLSSLIILFSISIINAQTWSDDMYKDHTFRTFEKLNAANKNINFKNIDYKLLNAAIFFETNRQRKKYSKERFGHSIALEKSAQTHSKDMVVKSFFSHTSKVKSRKKLSQRIAFGGLQEYYAAGENIAMTSSTSTTYLALAKDLVNIWMKSPGHRKNILNPDFKFMGCGAYFYKQNAVYATQVFSDMRAKNDIIYDIPKLKK